MSTKKPMGIKPAAATGKGPLPVRPWRIAGPPPPEADWLLVCLQDPFAAVGDSSAIVRATVPAAADDPARLWQLEAVLEMNAPRCFAGWATRGSFTLDLSVHAAARPAAGTWGGSVSTSSGSGDCRVIVMRDSRNKVSFSLATGTRHAPEQAMPAPDALRFLNADIAFELNGASGLSAGAVAVVSTCNWSRLIAGSSAATLGLAFDGKWRSRLDEGDGDASVVGAWAFVVLTQADYQARCLNHGWVPNIAGDA